MRVFGRKQDEDEWNERLMEKIIEVKILNMIHKMKCKIGHDRLLGKCEKYLWKYKEVLN